LYAVLDEFQSRSPDTHPFGIALPHATNPPSFFFLIPENLHISRLYWLIVNVVRFFPLEDRQNGVLAQM